MAFFKTMEARPWIASYLNTRSAVSHSSIGLRRIILAPEGLSDLLNIVIDTRNDVAHGTFLRRLTLREVRVHRVLVYRLIAKIESYMDAERARPGSVAS